MAILELVARFRDLASSGLNSFGKGLQDIEQSAVSADIRAAALEQRSRMLGQEMNRLAKEVTQGKLSVDDAEKKYNDFEKTLTKVETKVQDTRTAFGKIGDAVNGAGQAWMTIATPIESTIAVLERVGQTAKQAYQYVSEGADMALAAARFDNLTQSIGTTSEALMGDLRTATRGMVTDAELMESATTLINLGFAKTHDQAVRLSSVSGQLGWNMQQLALTLANQSTARLDSLGLAIEDVDGRAKELEKQGYKTDEAFQLAIIEAGEEKLNLLGSAAETAAGKLAIMEANAANFADSFKASFSQEMIANLNSFSGGMFEAEESSSKFGETLGKLVTNVSFLGFLRFAKEELKGLGEESKNAEGRISGMGGVAEKTLTGVASRTQESKQAAIEHTAAVKEQRAAIIADSAAIDGWAASLNTTITLSAQAARDIHAHSTALYQASPAYAELQDKVTQTNSLLSEEEAAFLQAQAAAATANAALYERVAAENAAADAAARHKEQMAAYNVVLGDYFAEAARGGNELELFTHNLDELGQQTYTVTNLTADQQAELDRLQTAYSKAQQAIRDYELGIKGATLTDDARNKKIEEQMLIMQTLEASMQPLLAAGSSVATSSNDLVISTSAVNSSLFEMVMASDASATSIAAAGLALGVFDETAAEAYLKTAILKIKMDELAEAFAKTGDVNALVTGMQTAVQEVNELGLQFNSAGELIGVYDEAANRATQSTDELINKFGEVPTLVETTLDVDSADAVNKYLTYKGYLESIPETVTTNIVSNYTATGSSSPGTADGSGGYQQMSTGGLVVGGTPGKDSVFAFLKPGERVLTEAENSLYENMMQQTGAMTSGLNRPLNANNASISQGDLLAGSLFGGGPVGAGVAAAPGGNTTTMVNVSISIQGNVDDGVYSRMKQEVDELVRNALRTQGDQAAAASRMRSRN